MIGMMGIVVGFSFFVAISWHDDKDDFSILYWQAQTIPNLSQQSSMLASSSLQTHTACCE
jgi:hypothetical protein